MTELCVDDVIIVERKLQPVLLLKVVKQLDCLTITLQETQLVKAVFKKNQIVFDGTLSKHQTAKIDIKCILGSKANLQNPYSFKRK